MGEHVNLPFSVVPADSKVLPPSLPGLPGLQSCESLVGPTAFKWVIISFRYVLG